MKVLFDVKQFQGIQFKRILMVLQFLILPPKVQFKRAYGTTILQNNIDAVSTTVGSI